MPGTFDHTIVSRVQQANDIIDVIGEHISLKRKGREMVGMCPFHDDHRPSLNVSSVKQIFKCFACGAGRGEGDGLRLLSGPVVDSDLVAAHWTPHLDFTGPDGRIPPRILWGALDCPGVWAIIRDSGVVMYLGRLTAEVDDDLEPGTPCTVIGWPMGWEGRKAFAVLPITEYEKLLAEADDARDLEIAAARDGAEAYPAAVAERIFAGESPLRVFRKYRGLTQTELAGRAGLGQNVVSRIESGKKTGTVSTLAALAKALGVTVDDLID